MHNEIKTYSLSDASENMMLFELKRMETLYRASKGQADLPHRHDYYTVIFIESAEGIHYVDFKEFLLEEHSIYFIQPGQVHQLITLSEPKGWVLTFNTSFLLQNGISTQLLEDIYLFNDYGESPPLKLSESEFAYSLSLIEHLRRFYEGQNTYRKEALGAILKVFLIQSTSLCSLRKESNPQLQEAGNRLLRDFKGLLETHYSEWHKVADYAAALAVSSDYLNKSIKTLTGKSAKSLISGKIITEAKRLLVFTDLSGKEMAFRLGFEEPSHFYGFFKRLMDQSPGEFREHLRNT